MNYLTDLVSVPYEVPKLRSGAVRSALKLCPRLLVRFLRRCTVFSVTSVVSDSELERLRSRFGRNRLNSVLVSFFPDGAAAQFSDGNSVPIERSGSLVGEHEIVTER